MSLTSEINSCYLTPTGTNKGVSAQIQEYAVYAVAGVSAPQQDFAIYSVGGMNGEFQEQTGGPVIVEGIDLSTGQFKLVSPGDTVTRSNSSIYSETGIIGLTGLLGVTGIAPLGDTGLMGFTGLTVTGIAGISGLMGLPGLYGETGISGDTGLLGITGLVGLVGELGEEGFRFLGDTGIQGFTGLIGVTGVSVPGATGLQGITGLPGNTGIKGLTGAAPNNGGLAGETGLFTGGTGVAGITGNSPRGAAGPLIILAAQNPATNSASYTLLADTLDANNQYLQLTAWGTLNSNINNTFTLTFDNNSLIAANVYLDTQPTGYNSFYMTTTILRSSATTQECVTKLTATGNFREVSRTAGTATLSTSNTLALTVDSGGIIRGFIIKKGLQV